MFVVYVFIWFVSGQAKGNKRQTLRAMRQFQNIVTARLGALRLDEIDLCRSRLVVVRRGGHRRGRAGVADDALHVAGARGVLTGLAAPRGMAAQSPSIRPVAHRLARPRRGAPTRQVDGVEHDVRLVHLHRRLLAYADLDEAAHRRRDGLRRVECGSPTVDGAGDGWRTSGGASGDRAGGDRAGLGPAAGDDDRAHPVPGLSGRDPARARRMRTTAAAPGAQRTQRATRRTLRRPRWPAASRNRSGSARHRTAGAARCGRTDR